ncbi:TrmB family transcriptional regulator [Candidatus Parvarchaeota archaeon]|jgi:Predicted transcriptional regulators|uniref:TrmB family transcriptional regulator n=1 Tax=Candidatus Acidifodinimicrobium mancum TaxID=2898728 RepID=A0A8T3V2M0_9ARCH|nr:TrmB family transcriptional regulator [Candidatus Acidifodinimicrobium mancum]MBE5728880.1 TrmB family transcriptional regulator [Candidatus Acidifodinimicrobium mancum]
MPLSFSEDYIGKVRRMFGLNMYEAKIWLALLSQGKSTNGKLSDLANIPKSRSYDILVSLENVGFVVRELGKPITYKATPPSELLANMKEKTEESYKAQVEKIEKLKDSEVLKDLQKLYEKGITFVKEGEVASAYQGLPSAFMKIKNEIRTAKDEVLIVSTEKSLEQKIRSLNRALAEAKAKGVSVKVYAPIEQLKEELEHEINRVGKFTKLNIDLGRFIIVDGKTVFIFTQNDKDVHPSSEVVVSIRGDYLVDKFKSLVEAHSK